MINNQGSRFIDEFGRTVMLRGVNLPAKLPVVGGEDLFDTRHVSFVGAPWPIDVAKEQAAKLQKLGMNFVRLGVTWEAVMHGGPNTFDEEYLTYLGQLVSILEEKGILVDIDLHQDAFSRVTGGDGAPLWVVTAAGLVPENFYETAAAITESGALSRGEPYPYLTWPSNLARLGCMTMFALFWGGATYAPKLKGPDGNSLQYFLQEQYLLFASKVAERVKHNKNILSIATMNELSHGYIGNTNLDQITAKVEILAMPTPLEGFMLADGNTRDIAFYKKNIFGFHKSRTVTLNTSQVKAWEESCHWRKEGVWDYDDNGEGVILRPNHFQIPNGSTFADAFYRPFAKEFYKRVRSARGGTRILIQTEEFIQPPKWDLEKDGSDITFGRHFYDPILTAFRWYQELYSANVSTEKPVFFEYFIRKSFRKQLAAMKELIRKQVGDVPFILGETGFEMNSRWSLLFLGPAVAKHDYRYIAKGADRIFQAVEANLLNVGIWCYDIQNTVKGGDNNWNKENFSVYCKDYKDPLRARCGWQRPYPMKTPGEPLHLSYDPVRGRFAYQFRFDSSIEQALEIYIPDFLTEGDLNIESSEGIMEQKGDLLTFFPKAKHGEEVWVSFTVKRPCDQSVFDWLIRYL